jgi:membrane-associated phospholipid phosphatase
MKHLLFLLFLMAPSVMTMHINAQQINSAAANWKTILLDNPQSISLAAPPSAAQTKSEIAEVKDRLNKMTEKKLTEIKYWDAGAPSYRWNQIGPQLAALKFDVQLRMPTSWMNLAVYDATVLAWNEKLKYKRKRPSETDASVKPAVNAPQSYSYPCEHSATASAAAYVMAYFVPAKADSIIQLARAASQSRIDAGLQYPSDVEAGWKLGEQVALQIIEKAKNDGSAKQWDGKMNKDPKKWTGAYPLGITMTSYTPMFLQSNDQFRPGPPPDFENEMKEMKNFKQTPKTTYIAHYWANSDIWTDLAALKMFEHKIHADAPAAARIYAVLTTAYHETALSVMDAKYAYWGIRPSQYDSTFKPIIATPPFPGYPSGHAMGAATSATVMEYFFPADAKQFKQLAQQCADSRFYAGIHFKTDNKVGLQMGNALGKYVVDTWIKTSK